MKLHDNHQSGFSLIELVVALGVAAFLVAAAMESFRIQNETYTVVDQTTEVQQNMRAIANLIERDVRSTALMVPEGFASCGVDSINAPDVLFVTDTDALFPFNVAGNQMIELDAMFSDVVGGTTATTAVGTRTITLDSLIMEDVAPNPFYDNDGAPGADSDFQVGGGIIALNREQPNLGTACGIVTAVNLGATQLTVNFLTPNAIPIGPTDDLIVVPAHVYQVANQGLPSGVAGGTFDLQRDGQVLARDVEDLQVAWFLDDGGVAAIPPLVTDGVHNPGANEFRGAAGNPVYLAVDPAAAGTDHRRLREIRVNLVVRTRSNTPGGDPGTMIQSGIQAMENRSFAVLPQDGWRRRVHTTTVRLRNVGWRGQMSKELGI